MKINTKILWRGLSMVLVLPAAAGLNREGVPWDSLFFSPL